MLASPWRRLGAAATDVVVLWLIHLPVVAVLLLGDPDWVSNSWLAVGWGSLAFGWLYLWVSWGWWSATPGQALWRLRVETTAGGRLTPGVAARRCLGYFLACVPVKAGLLPILWHPRRQGWHDRLAGTVVVDARRPREPLPPPPPPLHPHRRPDLATALRGLPLAALGYLLVTVVMTWPVAARFTSERVGWRGDGGHFMWNLWFFRHALLSGQPVTETDLLFWPNTVSLRFHTMNWLYCALSVPLLRVFSLTVVYNLLALASLASSATAAYLVACALTRRPAASFAAGLVFGFSPAFADRLMGHLNLIASQFVPLFLLCAYTALVTGRRRWAVGAGACLSLAAWCDWYHFVFAGTGLVCLWVGIRIAGGAVTLRRQVQVVGLSLLVGVVPLLPLVLPMLRERSFGDVALSDTIVFSAQLRDLVRLSPLHPLLHWPRGRGVGLGNSPGLAILVLAAVGLRRRWRQHYAWALMAMVATLLALGPVLRLPREAAVPNGVAWLLAGPPGQGLEPPWSRPETLAFAQAYLAGMAGQFAGPAQIPLPFGWLRKAVPLLRPFKVPARFTELTYLALAVLAAFGLAELTVRWRRRWGGAWASCGWAAVVLLILAEYCFVPCPTFPTAVDPFYHRLADEAGGFALVEVPLNTEVHEYQYYQTVHHQRLFMAHLSRLPPNAQTLCHSNPVLRLLTAPGWAFAPLGTAEVALVSGADAGDLADARQGLAELARLGARYVVLHPAWMSPDSTAAATELLGRRLGLPVCWRDDELTVFRVPANAAQLDSPSGRPYP